MKWLIVASLALLVVSVRAEVGDPCESREECAEDVEWCEMHEVMGVTCEWVQTGRPWWMGSWAYECRRRVEGECVERRELNDTCHRDNECHSDVCMDLMGRRGGHMGRPHSRPHSRPDKEAYKQELMSPEDMPEGKAWPWFRPEEEEEDEDEEEMRVCVECRCDDDCESTQWCMGGRGGKGKREDEPEPVPTTGQPPANTTGQP